MAISKIGTNSLDQSGDLELGATGNVGIGTSSPENKLTVNSTSASPVEIQRNGGANSNTSIRYKQASTSWYVGANPSNYFGFKYNDADLSSSPLMVIDTNGNVGIGTTSPARKLSINGNLGVESGTGTVAIDPPNSGFAQIDVSGANALRFNTNSAERMRIDSSGSLLLNTSSNIALSGRAVSLQIYQYNDIKEAITIKAASPSYNISSINFLNYGGSQVGYIYMTGSATQYSTSSDYRLKENIAPMVGALDAVAKLKPVTYNWKIDGSEGQGFIAHELAEVVPDCVHGEKDAVDSEGNPVYQGVDTSFLVATLTAAIQELKKEFDEYKASHP